MIAQREYHAKQERVKAVAEVETNGGEDGCV